MISEYCSRLGCSNLSKLKPCFKSLREHYIEENMLFDLLHLICGDPDAIDYSGVPKVERERYENQTSHQKDVMS